MADLGKRKRRSYAKAFKRRVVAETLEPGASVAAVARQHGLNTNMVFLWRGDPRFGPGRDAAVFPLAGLLAPEVNVTAGNVSALAGIGGDATMLQHTAAIQPGNSGGPLLDDLGNVVGVVVAKANAVEIARATGDIPENIAFAIKSSIARDFLDAEGINYALAVSGVHEDIANLVVKARPYVALLLCMN